jgi:hypothetical protein
LYVLSPNESKIYYFGWPDYFGDGEPVTDSKFQQSHTINGTNPNFLIKRYPLVTKPLVQLGHAIGHTQLAISNNTAFSKKGLLYIGEFGTIAPVTHIRQGFLGEQGKLVGQKIVVVNASSGTQSDLVSLKNPSASFRPVGLGFDSNGTSLYIADFG